MPLPFTHKISPSHLPTISRRRVIGGLLLLATPVSWVSSPLAMHRQPLLVWRPLLVPGRPLALCMTLVPV
jgi:hypothetical protein